MNSFQKQQTNRILASFFGTEAISLKGVGVLIVVIFILTWLPDGMSGILEDYTAWLGWLQFCSALLMLFVTYLYLKNNIRMLPVTIDIKGSKKAKVLIIFLSSNKEADEAAACRSIESLERNNYRMPLVAIDHHRSRLKKIIVACSKDSCHQFDRFKECVSNVLPDFDASIIEVKNLDSFEDAKGIYDFLDDTFRELAGQKFREKEIVIDVTGGQKIVSIAACIYALPNDREIEYVSTTDYGVKTYDIKYDRESA